MLVDVGIVASSRRLALAVAHVIAAIAGVAWLLVSVARSNNLHVCEVCIAPQALSGDIPNEFLQLAALCRGEVH
jgi:hypothetical protein